MQLVSSRIWTCVVVSVSYDDNYDTTGTSSNSIKVEAENDFKKWSNIELGFALICIDPNSVNVKAENEAFCSVRQWLGRSGFNPRSSYTKDLKNGTWYLLA